MPRKPPEENSRSYDPQEKLSVMDHDDYLLRQCRSTLEWFAIRGQYDVSLAEFLRELLDLGEQANSLTIPDRLNAYTRQYWTHNPQFRFDYENNTHIGVPSLNPHRLLRRVIATLAVLHTQGVIHISEPSEREEPIQFKVLPPAWELETQEFVPLVEEAPPDGLLPEAPKPAQPPDLQVDDDIQPMPPLDTLR